MADEGNVISNLDLGAPNGEDTAPAAGIISQYVKDLSVENPNAPDSYQWQDAPQVDVQFKLAYCALAGVRNIDAASAHAFYFAEVPRIVFPFARRVIADAVRDAGFQPIMLEPIDFNGLYMQQLATQQQAEAEAPAGNA